MNIQNHTQSTKMGASDLESVIIWLKNEIANVSQDDPESIDLNQSLADLALNSMNVVRLAGKLEELLGLEVDPSFMYEYDTIDDMIRQLYVMYERHIEREELSGQTPLDIHIAASFTSEPVEESLNYFLSRLAFKARVKFAPYNQIFQELLNPRGMLLSNISGVNVILFRVEDWFRFRDAPASLEQVHRTIDDFISAVSAAEMQVPLIFGLCPHSYAHVRKCGLADVLNDIDNRIIEALSGVQNIHILDLRKLTTNYRVNSVLDHARDKLGHIPFTHEYFTAIGVELARRIIALLGRIYKVIVLDCDNTLWNGIVGEDGVEGIEISPGHQFLQNFAAKQKGCGKILCISSKNNESDVWDVFDNCPEMILKKDDIVASRINWNRKSDSIRSLSAELGLAVDSFIFIDDNPAECAEVQSALPEVLVVQLPNKSTDMPAFLNHHWAFDVLKTTAEDSRRSEMYIQSKKRMTLHKNVGDFEEFLEQLQVEIEIDSLTKSGITRASQLTQRTNQFNATTIRCTESDITVLMNSDDTYIHTVNVEDRFGDYGFVGLMVSRQEGGSLVCESFMMSCRVLGRKVEHEMVRFLAKFAAGIGCKLLTIQYSKTDGNKPIKEFFNSIDSACPEMPKLNTAAVEDTRPPASNASLIGGRMASAAGNSGQALDSEWSSVDGGGPPLTFETSSVDKVLSGSKVEHQLESGTEKTHKLISVGISSVQKSQALAEIANLKGDVRAVLGAIRSTSRVDRPNIDTVFVTPRTSWQKKIAAIWCNVLGMNRIGIYDSFYELGGDSLRAAEVFAEMWDLGVPDSVSLQTIPDPTVAGLCQAIEDVKAGKRPTLLMDEFSLEDEGALPDDIHNNEFDISSYDRPMKQVLLTGATGYIGAFLIHELFTQADIEINCLVRASTADEGHARVIDNLARYKLWKDEYNERIKITLGELTEPLFGLDESEFKALGHSIDTIFHSGAWVNFVFPYQHLKAANVDSVETIMRLAIVTRPQPIQLHFISTLGVIMSTGYKRDEVVLEDRELDHCEDLLNGYEQSKYVGDKMVWQGIKERGIPASMYRPGMVSGLGDSGVYHKLDEFLPSFLKGCIQLGSWPLLNTTWELVPVDYVTKAIVHIARDPANLGKAYFSQHPESRMVEDYIKWHQDFGYSIRALPWDVWKRELLNQGADRLRQNALFPFVDFIRALSEEQVYFPATDKRNFLQGISDLNLKCPDQLELLERYTRYFISVDYYDPPPNNPEFASL